MIRRSRDVQVFNVSFLDLLSCALGGVLLLLLITMSSAQQQANSMKSQMEDFKMKKIKLTEKLGLSQQAIAELLKKQQSLDNALKALREDQSGLIKAKSISDAQQKELNALLANLKKMQKSLIGLKGDLTDTVFLFDTSESMGRTGKFDEHRNLLKTWVEHLPHKKFNVVQFFGLPKHVKTWEPGTMVKTTPTSRAEANKFIDKFQPWGTTPSRTALKIAFDLKDVTNIILFSDGAPTDVKNYKVILKEVRQWQDARAKRITINTIGMGNYFKGEHGAFLQELASENGGAFIGQ